jgi:hypothetical protein
MKVAEITFPDFAGARCLMMPYIQGDPASVPDAYVAYSDILSEVVICRGDIGFLTIDESAVRAGQAHRAARAKYARALHTEAGRIPGYCYKWGGSGGGGWGSRHHVELERNVEILLANNIDDTCAIWDCEHENTSDDGDIGHFAESYPYSTATFLKAGEVHKIGILTPHESLPVIKDGIRQFLRIIGSGVHGREPYFTVNPLLI